MNQFLIKILLEFFKESKIVEWRFGEAYGLKNREQLSKLKSGVAKLDLNKMLKTIDKLGYRVLINIESPDNYSFKITKNSE